MRSFWEDLFTFAGCLATTCYISHVNNKKNQEIVKNLYLQEEIRLLKLKLELKELENKTRN